MSHGFLPSSEEWSGKIRARKALLPVGRAAPAAGLPERIHGKHNVFSGQDGSSGRSGETPLPLFPCASGLRRGRGGRSDGKRGAGTLEDDASAAGRSGGAGVRTAGRPFFRPPPTYASPPLSPTCFPATAEGTAAKTGAGKAERGEAGSGTARQAQERRKARRQEVEAASAQSEEASAAGRSRTGRSGTKKPREKRRTAGGGKRPDRKTFMQGAEL